jgi:flagellar biogenesis protein FliO
MLMLAGKFVLVLMLLFICLRVLRALMPRLSGGASRGGIVLHTESIGAKQTVQVLDLGTRIVVIGLTGTTMAALTTIADEEEMAALRARYGPKAPMRAAMREQPTTTTDAPEQPTSTLETAQPAAERPTFAQALSIAMARSLGRSGPLLPGEAPANKETGRPSDVSNATASRRTAVSAEGTGILPSSAHGRRSASASAASIAHASRGERRDQGEDSALGRSLAVIRSLRRKYEES